MHQCMCLVVCGSRAGCGEGTHCGGGCDGKSGSECRGPLRTSGVEIVAEMFMEGYVTGSVW